MNVGDKAPVTLTATLEGNPGSFEGEASFAVVPPEAGTVDPVTLEFTALAETVGAVVKAMVDNLEGEAKGELVGESLPFDITAAPVILADTLDVKVG
jgi:hypothetical protein